MKYFSIFLVMWLSFQSSVAQAQSDTTYSKPVNDLPDTSAFPIVNADFLFGYYEQNGNHSPVTGGLGTELLWDYVGQATINVQLDSFKAFTVDFGIDQYTSASTDNIDFAVSSASVRDSRKHANLDYTITSRKKSAISFGTGFSTEWDVNSVSLNFSYNKRTKSENTGFGIGGQFFHDRWDLIYPIEMREQVVRTGIELLPTDIRTLAVVNMNAFHIINKRTQVGIFADFMQQNGLLSTPFHRVFFNDGTRAVERLPDTKWKLPISTRIHYFAFDRIVLKWFNRYYIDAFDLQAFTTKLDVVIKMSNAFSFAPSYRWHTQTAAKYFQPYLMHQPSDEYYTSDYDLSTLQSHRIAAAFQYTPIYGIFKLNIPGMRKDYHLKSVAIKLGYFMRSDGLKSTYTNFGMTWIN